MTKWDWAAILASLNSPDEIKDCLLMLADDLDSEQGAEMLRGLANRPEGLKPYVCGGGCCLGWIGKPYHPSPTIQQQTGTVTELFGKMEFGNYKTKQLAWAGLLKALP